MEFWTYIECCWIDLKMLIITIIIIIHYLYPLQTNVELVDSLAFTQDGNIHSLNVTSLLSGRDRQTSPGKYPLNENVSNFIIYTISFTTYNIRAAGSLPTSVLTASSRGHSKITCWTVRGASLHHPNTGVGVFEFPCQRAKSYLLEPDQSESI